MKKLLSLVVATFCMVLTLTFGICAYAADDGGTTPVQPVSMSDCVVTLSYTKTTCNMKEKKPSVKVVYNGQTLANGTDYTVFYTSNVKCGTSTVTVTGNGTSYVSSVKRTFRIVPQKVTSVKVTARSSSSITLSWKSSPGAYGYRVYQATSKSGNYKRIANVIGKTTCKSSKLSASKKYYYKVVAYGIKDGGYSADMSSILSTTTWPPTPKSVYAFVKSGNLYVKWNKAKPCSGYVIEYTTDKNFDKNVKRVYISNTSTTTKTIKGVSNSKLYYVKVKCYTTAYDVKVKGTYSKKLSTNFNHQYSYYSSKYVSNANRTTNLRIASNKINGTILMPGDTFSFNNVVGQRTYSKGYKDAYIFSGSGTVSGVGGGICQVASTMFNTALFANVSITERHQHSQKVSYVPVGRDAAIYWGSQDFKWKNNTGYPIKITMSVSGGVISCKFSTTEDYKPKSVKLTVTKSGMNYTLKRSVGGNVNYTAKSRY